MRRRQFVGILGGMAVGFPSWGQAQQPATPVVGFVNTASPDTTFLGSYLDAFKKGLAQGGFIEGRNVAIEYRWAHGQYDQLPVLATDLVRRKVAVIVSSGGAATAKAVKEATATIPIVFISGGDPVKYGLVDRLNRPQGNLTGVTPFINVLGAKRLEFLREFVPAATEVALLLNPKHPESDTTINDVSLAARASGQRIHVFRASDAAEIDTAFTAIAQNKIGALIVSTDPILTIHRDQLLILPARYKLPAIYDLREYAATGGLMSYGDSITESYRQVGTYTARILKGEAPANLPIVQPTKFEFVINLKTAKALGLDVPPKLLALADEVIE